MSCRSGTHKRHWLYGDYPAQRAQAAHRRRMVFTAIPGLHSSPHNIALHRDAHATLKRRALCETAPRPPRLGRVGLHSLNARSPKRNKHTVALVRARLLHCRTHPPSGTAAHAFTAALAHPLGSCRSRHAKRSETAATQPPPCQIRLATVPRHARASPALVHAIALQTERAALHPRPHRCGAALRTRAHAIRK